MWIKKFVLGGAALSGGLRRAVKRARGDKGGATTFTVPTPFAVLAAVLSSGFVVGLGGHGGRIGRCGFDTRLGCFGVRHTFYWRRRVVRAVFGRGMRRRLRFRRLRVWFKCAASFCSSRLYGRADVGDSHGRSGRPRGRAPAVLWRTHVGSRRGRGMPSRMAHGLARFQCSILNLRLA